jgi:hypothetical protein
MLNRLTSDVKKAGAGDAGATDFTLIPFRPNSLYSVHRRLFPDSKLRKWYGLGFGFFVISLAFLALCAAAGV